MAAAVPTTKTPTRQMWQRSLFVLVLMVVFGFTGITGRLVVLQLVESESWYRKAVSQQLQDTVTSPNRGTIYDANMNVLAESQLVWTVIMSPYEIKDSKNGLTVLEKRNLIADDLSVMFGLDRETLYTRTGKTYSQYEPVVKKIDRQTADAFLDWVKEHGLSSIFRVINDYKRVYPYNTLAADVLGFTGADSIGRYGLEAEYDSVLEGKAGRVVTARNGWGEEMPNALSFEKTIDAEDGHNLMLTIDQNIQHFTEKHLEVAIRDTSSANRGLAIVMDVNTGAILAMAVKSDFNPNNPQAIGDEAVAAMIAALAGDEQAAALQAAREKQWANKAIEDFYEPGSVFKIFTAAMALEEGVVDEDDTFRCGSQITIDGSSPIKCHYSPRDHGVQNIDRAISNSCNPVFIQISQRIGQANFFKYYQGFGFTERTGIDLLGESLVTSSLYHKANMSNVSLATCSIGQTFKVTPIQMITALAAVANGGRLMQPYVVQKEFDNEGNVLRSVTPTVKRQVISEETSVRLTAMLYNSVNNGGGGKNAYVPGYRIAGKTGTSEKTEIKNRDEVWASFGCYAPSDKPEVAILVILDEPQCNPRFGSTISAPVAGKIMADVLPYLGVEPVYTAEELSKMNVTTPKVEGKELAVAKSTLTGKGLTCTVVGDGGSVVRQVPASGVTISKGGNVVLYTEEDSGDNLVRVPDFTNMSVSQANAAAVNAGLNLVIKGLSSNGGDAIATKQSEEAKTMIEKGSVITVEFIYRDRAE